MQRDKQDKHLDNIRHSLAHLLAASVLKKFPKAKLGIGPTIETGFYYDFLLPRPLAENELKELEKEMRSLIKANLPFKGERVTPAQARKIFKDQPFKLELINEFVKEKKPLTVYRTGEVFLDLCRGGHVKNTKEIDPEAFALKSTAGAYWRGDEKNPMLTRIYGLSFATSKELQAHLKMLEEAEKRDHRKLGKELGLFVFSDLVGPGLPLYKPKGTLMLQKIKEYSNEIRNELGYEEVHTPQINKAELFKTSGHYDKYKEDMFHVRSNYTEEEYFLKPMNCPQHTQIYASETRSYKDLPIRIADFANLYRDEKPGELNGLTRLRAFSQDDGHCFCREDQIEGELSKLLSGINQVMKTYKMDYTVRLSLRDEKNKNKYLGDDAIWKKSQKIMKELLENKKIKFYSAPGEAAFYGPKFDLMARDSLGREWQLSTIQLDFNMPKRFSLEYVGADGKKYTPVMIHSALVGSRERFLGVLIEHFAGAFPLWLSPVQVVVIPVTEKQNKYAYSVNETLKKYGIRAEVSPATETLGKRIRAAETAKTPYVLIVGEKEASAKTVSLRSYRRGQEGEIALDELVSRLQKEIAKRS